MPRRVPTPSGPESIMAFSVCPRCAYPHTDEEALPEDGLVLLQRLTRDMAQAAALLSPAQQRVVVDYYYQLQEARKRAFNQLRAQASEPNAFIDAMSGYMLRLEKSLVKALDHATSAHPVSRWAKHQMGIGPVLAAGLAAHIDITRTKTVSALWRFAGLDPTLTWHGAEQVRQIVRAARQAETDDWHALVWVCRSFGVRPGALLRQAGLLGETLRLAPARELLTKYGGDLTAVAAVLREGDTVLLSGLENPAPAFAEAYPGVTWDWEKLVQRLSRRPWNARLKVLQWKCSDSWVKLSKNPACYYGQIYLKRKMQEVEKNAAGDFQALAEKTLKEKNIQAKETRQWYEDGKLPPGRLDLRARRYASKRFLQHYWQVAYEVHYQEKAPLPYIVARDPALHTQWRYDPPPGWPFED